MRVMGSKRVTMVKLHACTHCKEVFEQLHEDHLPDLTICYGGNGDVHKWEYAGDELTIPDR